MAVLARYNFDALSLAADTVGTGITAGDLAAASLAELTVRNDLGYPTPVLFARPAGGATSAAGAVSNNSYYSFTLSAAAAFFVSEVAVKAARGGASAPRGLVIRWDLDGYASDLLSEAIPTQRATLTSYAPAVASGAVTSVTFRVYVYSPAASASQEHEDLTISGDLPGGSPLLLRLLQEGLYAGGD